jgi:LacI family transcriptional regulator, gluconate utilization system Gnt-I transcriptional repressor
LSALEDKRTRSSARASSTGRLTLEDIARKVGVSSITVSRAFRHPDTVSPEVRERIHLAAKEMGYVRNRAASALASARSMNIAVLVPSLSNSVFVDTLDGIEKVLRPKGYQMILGISHYGSNEEEALVRTFLSFDPDGILLTGFNYCEDTRHLIARSNVPVVHMMELSHDKEAYSVGFSQEDAAIALTEHILQRGCRRVAFIASQLDSRALARRNGYRDTLIRAGLYDASREVLEPEPSSVALGGRLLDRLMQQAPDCDAVFFCNDDLAQGGLFECLRRGIRVPEQLAMAGFNDLAGSSCTVPSLTTVATPRFDVGVKSADMLITLIEGKPVKHKSLDLGFVLMARDSA